MNREKAFWGEKWDIKCVLEKAEKINRNQRIFEPTLKKMRTSVCCSMGNGECGVSNIGFTLVKVEPAS